MEYFKHGIRGMRGKTSFVKLKWSGVFLDVFEQKKRFSLLDKTTDTRRTRRLNRRVLRVSVVLSCQTYMNETISLK